MAILKQLWREVEDLFSENLVQVLILALAITAMICGMWYLFTTPSYVTEPTLVEGRWAIVETHFRFKDQTYEGKAWRRHVIAPDGQWYIIPKAYQEWANEIVEGESVYIPRTIRQWPQPAISIDDDWRTAMFLKGLVEFKTDDKGHQHTTRGIYFFDRDFSY